MAVTIHLFAALRDAAGTSVARVEPGPLPDVLGQLEARFGDRFSSRMRVASVLIDGDPVDRAADVQVRDGAEMALLPPFSGGSGPLAIRARRRAVRRCATRPAGPVAV